MLTITKKYTDFPCGHRQHLHDGHCRFLHGHDFAFEFTFGCKHLDETGFVLDFGKLAFVKELLTAYFDHTFIVSETDPDELLFRHLESSGHIKLRFLPSTSAEGIAEFVFKLINSLVREKTQNRAFVAKVTVWEDSKNSATVSSVDV